MYDKIYKVFIDSNIDIIDLNKLTEYIKFCLDNDLKTATKLTTSRHHILPKSLFKEYSDLNKNLWNSAHLSYSNHYIAHSILAQSIHNTKIIGAWWMMNFKDKIAKNISGEKLIGEKVYSELFAKATLESSIRNSNKVVCRLKENPEEYISVPSEEYKSNRHLYLGATEGKISVIEKISGNRIFISSEEYNYNKNLYIFHKTNSTVKQSSIDKMIKTNSKIESNGKTKGQNSSIRGINTLKNTIMEDGRTRFEHVNETRGVKGEKHHKAKTIFIYDNNGEVKYKAYGNIKNIIADNNLPVTLIGSYKNCTTLGTNLNVKTRMTNSGFSKFIGWYARIIK